MAQADHPVPDLSVIIARVSMIDGSRVFDTLDALRHQDGDVAYEVIIADRLNDADSAAIRHRYPEFRLLECPPGTSVPELRAISLEAASGSIVAVTEDHCVPPPDWVGNLVRAFEDAPKGTAAVGGSIANGVAERALDRATFLCEYAQFQSPVPEGPCDTLPGMNLAYRRSVLQGFDRETLQKGFWETTLHPDMLRQGSGFFLTDRIRIRHCKKFSLGSFLRQRFLYSRHFAGSRAAGQSIPQRLAMLCLSFLLPPLLMGRLFRILWHKPASEAGTFSALPLLMIFVLVGVCGELAGQIAGPGDALSRLE